MNNHGGTLPVSYLVLQPGVSRDELRDRIAMFGRGDNRVTELSAAYRLEPGTPDIELVPDGAYWVDDLLPIDASTTPAGDMVVDLTSRRCTAGHDILTERVTGSGIDPAPWVNVGRDPSGTVPIVAGNVISGTLTNVASVTVDRSDACSGPGEGVALDIETDARTVITVRD
jgi:hypothetical protein